MAFVLKRTLLVALLLGLLLGLAAWYSHKSQEEAMRVSLLSEATLLAEHAARSLEGIDLTLRDLVRRIETRWRAGEPLGPRFHDLLKVSVGDLPQVTGLMILDKDGRLVADQVAGRRGDLDVSARAYYRTHRDDFEPGRLFLGDPLRGAVSGRSFFTASYGLSDPQGEFGGVAVAVFDPFYYRHYYQRFEPDVALRDVALVDGSGIIMASSADFSVAVGVPLGSDTFEEKYKPDIEDGELMRLNLPQGGQYLAVMARVPGFPFYSFVSMPYEAGMRDWTRLAIGMVLAWAMAVFGTAAAAYGIWQRENARQQAYEAMEEANREARAALDRAEAANAAKSRFLAHISHELRTPLNAILGFSEVIRDRVFGPEQNKDQEYAGLIHKSGRHLLHIINDILDLSRIEAGKLAIRRHWVAVPTLLEAAELLTSRDFSDHRLRFETRVPPDCPQLYVDEKATKQMLVNLLSNAAKFSPDGGHVIITARPRGDGGLDLLVEDEGPGIPPERLPSLFEPFSQAQGQTAGKGQGTGLGLPLVKSLIELHGGSISVEQGIGGGACMILHFPPPPHDAAPPDETSRTPSGNGLAEGAPSQSARAAGS